MSRVYFHSQSDTAELRGSERAYASRLANAVGIATLDLDESEFRFIKARYPVRDRFTAELALRVNDGVDLAVPSGSYSAWEVLLNTCMAVGNDVLCFMARMHAQCEIHAWVSGEDRAWLAAIIAEGRRVGMMRDGQGWEDVSSLLLAADDEPVVMSYSVCGQFPNASVAKWEPPMVDWEYNHDAWHNLPNQDRWRFAMAGIEQMRFGPSTLRGLFGHCKTAFDIRREMQAATR